MRAFDNGDGVNLHVTEVFDGIERACFAAAEGGCPIQTLGPQGDGPRLRQINFRCAVHGINDHIVRLVDKRNTFGMQT